MRTFLGKAGIITADTVAHLHVDIWIIYSAIYISPFTNDKVLYIHNFNYQIHSVHTRVKTDFHPPIANLTQFQKAVYYSGIKIFNNLPHNIKDLANETKWFRNSLKRFLPSNSFYNSEEYFNYQR